MTPPGGDAGSTPSPAPARRRRTWFQRFVITFNIFVVLACVTAATALTQYREEITRIPRAQGQGVLTEVTEPHEPVNFLVVGVDNAEGLDPDDPVLRGRDETLLLSDTIMIVRVDPEANRAWLLSVPRDLYVPLASTGARAKINSALALGGWEELANTVQQTLDIPIHHYVQVNFRGFTELVDLIGGVPVWFEHPSRDRASGLHVESPGCANLEGDQALAFVRSRSFEALVDGRWRTDPTGDLGRITRQQVFVRAALNRAISRGARNPLEQQRMVEAARGEVVLDDRLSIASLLDLGERLREFSPETLETFTLPTSSGMAGSASVQRLREREAQPILQHFRDENIYSAPASLVRVQVRNGSGIAGQAAAASEELRRSGFTITMARDANRFGEERTRLLHGEGDLRLAVFLARFFDEDLPIEEADPGEDLGDANVVLITGSDWEDWDGLLEEPRPPEEWEDLLEPEEVSVREGGWFAPRADAGDGGESDLPGVTTTTIPPTFVPDPPDGVRCG